MRALGGGYGDGLNMQQMVGRTPEVRPDHEARQASARSGIRGALAESTQTLREAGLSLRSRGVGGGGLAGRPTPGAGGAAGSAASSPLRQQAMSASEGARQPPAALAAARRRPASPLPSPRSLRGGAVSHSTGSARELFAAICGAPETTAAAGPPREITLRDYQRGVQPVAPAPTLPYPGPDGLAPGQRRRAAAVASGDGSGQSGPVAMSLGAGEKAAAVPADGRTSMLSGARCALGELATAPVAQCSAFAHLLDRLVDSPEACFADPLAAWKGAAAGAAA